MTRRHPAISVLLACLGVAAFAAGQTQPESPTPPPAPAPILEPEESDLEPETIITLADGRRITGYLIRRDPDRIILRIGAIPTEFAVGTLSSVRVLPPIMVRYRTMREAIDEKDPVQLVQLAEWLRSRDKFDLAIELLDKALEVDAEHEEAKRLRRIAVSQRDLAAKTRERTVEPGPKRVVEKPSLPAVPTLREDQINLIKVYEIDLKDPPRILIDRDTINRLIARFAGDSAIPATTEGRDALLREDPAKILELMFKLQARDLYREVRVVGEPRSMATFRDNLHRSWIVNSCATAKCHGGTDAGRLVLASRQPNSDATCYTNFLILERFRTSSGKALIDYEEPHRSPLLQLGLPRDESLFPHPPVGEEVGGDQWRPFFRSTDDRRFVQAVEWIQTMYMPRPAYPIEYTPLKPFVPEVAAPAEGAASRQGR